MAPHFTFKRWNDSKSRIPCLPSAFPFPATGSDNDALEKHVSSQRDRHIYRRSFAIAPLNIKCE